jgi:hypothetical protein
MKQLLKALAPKPLVRIIRRYKQRIQDSRNASRPAREVFSEIYRDGHWGSRAGDRFCSGTGSATQAVTEPYIETVVGYLKSAGADKTIVDLGCGDMVIGQNFLDFCTEYIGVDVVDDLIKKHRSTYKDRNTKFLCLDIVDDDLPDGDICFVRQVLQHLSNDQVARILQKLRKYKVCFITEHYPADNAQIEPNKDIVHGSRIRVYENSGVYLDKPPFNIPEECIEKVLEVPGCKGDDSHWGVIRTYKIDYSASR